MDFRAIDHLGHLCDDGDIEGVRASLQSGLGVNSKTGSKGRTPLMRAIIYEQNALVRFLLENPNIDVNRADLAGETALHHAVDVANSEAVQMLLAHPKMESINKEHKGSLLGFGDTPLMQAVTMNRVDCVSALLADPRVDLDARTTFHKKCGKWGSPEDLKR